MEIEDIKLDDLVNVTYHGWFGLNKKTGYVWGIDREYIIIKSKKFGLGLIGYISRNDVIEIKKLEE